MAALLIAFQEIRRALRDPIGLALTLAVPLALITAIGFVADRAPFSAPPADGFDALSWVAPGMALFFMMFSVRQSARTIAEDGGRGIRDRLHASPARRVSVTAGTTASHVALVFLQLCVLIGVSTFAYGLRWGAVGPVLLLCALLSVASAGWVAFLVAVGRDPQRISTIGTMLTLVFAILSRSFAAFIPSAAWMDAAARVTPNYWGLHAFAELALGEGMRAILGDLGALALMAAALWLLSTALGGRARLAHSTSFGRRGPAGRAS